MVYVIKLHAYIVFIGSTPVVLNPENSDAAWIGAHVRDNFVIAKNYLGFGSRIWGLGKRMRFACVRVRVTCRVLGKF